MGKPEWTEIKDQTPQDGEVVVVFRSETEKYTVAQFTSIEEEVYQYGWTNGQGRRIKCSNEDCWHPFPKLTRTFTKTY